MIIRKIKILFSLMAGCYMGIIVFNNITDYHSNFYFLSMVTKMSDVFSYPINDWRHIDSIFLQHFFYIFIILTEITISILLVFGTNQMWKELGSDSQVFSNSMKLSNLGFSLGIFLWFFVFITIGGEWFLMWQSEKWNAQGTAFSLTICFILFLIFQNQPEV